MNFKDMDILKRNYKESFFKSRNVILFGCYFNIGMRNSKGIVFSKIKKKNYCRICIFLYFKFVYEFDFFIEKS